MNQESRLSVAILVRDAADPLRLTLASIRGIADEIIVVDTGSTDRSRQVAQEFDAQVFDCPWSDDFSAARNFAQSRVTSDWILWLDAGETIREEDGRALRHQISTTTKDQAFVLLVRVPGRDAQAADEQIGRIRLVPNNPALLFKGRVRESLNDSIVALGWPVHASHFVIHRDHREHETRLKKQRAHRNLKLVELQQAEGGPTASLWNCAGDAFQTLEDGPRAAECFRQALAVADKGSADSLEAFYGLLTSLDGNGSNHEDQLTVCLRALEDFPLDAQLLCALGGYLQLQSQTDLAMKAYITAYKYGQVQPVVWHVAEIREVAGVCYSICLQLQQQEEEAFRFLEDALRENDGSLRIRRRLIEMYVTRGQREPALAHVSALPKETPHKEALRSAVRGACFAAQKNWIAAKAYLNAAFGHGCRDPLCLKWLTVCLLACQELNEARKIIEQWEQVEPRNAEPRKLLKLIDAKLNHPETADRHLRVDSPAVPLPTSAIMPGSPLPIRSN